MKIRQSNNKEMEDFVMKVIIAIGIGIVSIFILSIFTNTIMSLSIFAGSVKGDVGNWIGFYGTLIGGLLTLAGVFLTLQFNKKQINKQEDIRKKAEAKYKNLNTIKILLEIELSLATLVKELDILVEFNEGIISTIDVHEYALLGNRELDNKFYRKGIKPSAEQIKNFLGEVGIDYTYEKFIQVQDQLHKTKKLFDNKNLQVKSAEIDWEIYEKINYVTNELYGVFDTQKCVTTIESPHLAVFKSELELIIKKINGMKGIIEKVIGLEYVVREKRNEIEKQYFNIPETVS